jgi:hypothetical protein
MNSAPQDRFTEIGELLSDAAYVCRGHRLVWKVPVVVTCPTLIRIQPAQSWTLACRRCENLTPEREAELTEPRPCVLCGSDGYTSDAKDWLCEGCWRAGR